MNKTLLIIIVLILLMSCKKIALTDVTITKKQLMYIYTIGWNEGFQEGFDRNSNEWSESTFIIDSCQMSLYLTGINKLKYIKDE